MSRWWNRSMHDKILIGTARAVLFIMFVCLCMLDSDGWYWFLMVALLCIAYLSAYAYANKDYRGKIL